MRLIIKHTSGNGSTHLFNLDEKTCNKGGFISLLAFNLLMDTEKFEEVDAIEIIEKYHKHSVVTAYSDVAKYYQLKECSKD